MLLKWMEESGAQERTPHGETPLLFGLGLTAMQQRISRLRRQRVHRGG